MNDVLPGKKPAPRFDLYATAHKGVRRTLSVVLTELGSADLRDDAATRRVADLVLECFEMLDGHLGAERRFVMPMLETCAPFVAGTLGGDHAGQETEIAELRLLCALLNDGPVVDRIAVGRELYRRFGLLVADELQHMAREEDQGNRALWACYSDEALIEIHGRILASFGEKLLDNVAWLAPALDPEERSRLLGNVARRAPAQALHRLLETLRQVLSPEEYARLGAVPRRAAAGD